MDLTALNPYLGQIAGVATSILWTITSLFFTAAGRRVGATVVNATRILFACVLLAITHRLLQGFWLPDVPAAQVGYLALSGLLGLTIGDQAIIIAYVEIGPRLTLLVSTTSPLWAALLARLVLGEHLPSAAWLGMAITIAGILVVVGERSGPAGIPRHTLMRGLALALLAAFCQSGGYLLSKMGMGYAEGGRHVEPQTATLLRMVFAGITVVPLLGTQLWLRRNRPLRSRAIGQSSSQAANAEGLPPSTMPGSAVPNLRPAQGAPNRTPESGTLTTARWRSGILLSMGGAVTGPFLGVWLSLVACDRAPLGVAQTLLTLSPVFILPATAILHRERISARAVIGALLAVGGAAVLFQVR